MPQWWKRWSRGLVTASMLVAAGCAKQAPPRLPVFPVEGKVVFESKAPTNAMIVFHPIDGKHKELPKASVGTDGTFRVSTYDPDDGAPAGEYAVTIQWYQRPQSSQDEDAAPVNQLSQKYADPNLSPLRVQVNEGPNVVPPFVLVRNP